LIRRCAAIDGGIPLSCEELRSGVACAIVNAIAGNALLGYALALPLSGALLVRFREQSGNINLKN